MDKKRLYPRLQSIFDQLYSLQDEGVIIADTFHRLPLRTGNDYYKVVRNPLSFHAIGRKIKRAEYQNAQAFINDLAQISWNARLYNRRDSVFYRHATALMQFVTSVALPALNDDGSLVYPNLGRLPEEEDMDASDDPFLQNDNVLSALSLGATTPLAPFKQSPEFSPPVHKPRHPSFRPPKHIETGIRRGRPPIIDKPFETRIKLILKLFKKLRDPNNEARSLTAHFEKLPDSKLYTDYYDRIPNPISLNEIKIKVRTRKYSNVELFIHDLDLMFANFQMYHESDPYSEEYMDFVSFNREAQLIIQTELNKSDRELIGQSTSGNDGVIRYPLDSLEVNGHTYKIGDWVLIANQNDPEKPAVGQVFRLWLTDDGNRYTNVCWYYRPEQTCHKHDRLFFKNEVCKTGQYRDHLVNEIVGPCYVVFLTRYQKGDLPQGVVPEGAPWFICEFRYNELSHVFNRIRTWKACLPDEVRDNFEQPLVPLREPRKLIKFDSPIKQYLPKDAYLGMGIPEPTQGPHLNSPPLMGLVYLAPPLEDDDLGQYISSPNVMPVPEHDDLVAGRRAFLFTPISQLKGGGGATNTVYTTSLVPIHTANSATGVEVIPGLAPPRRSTRTDTLTNALPGGYRLLLSQIQDAGVAAVQRDSLVTPHTDLQQQHHPGQYQYPQYPQYQQQQQQQQQQEQSLLRRSASLLVSATAPAGTSFYSSKNTYLTLLLGGIVSYTIGELGDPLENTSDHINKRPRLGEDGEVRKDIVFYRAPPVLVEGNRIITQNGLEFGHLAAYLALRKRSIK